MAKHPLREARERVGISQSKLAREIGVNAGHINEIEAWKRYPCPSWRDKLSRFFGIAEHELFPKPEDLIDMIRDLIAENKRLQELLDGRTQISPGDRARARDNSQFL